MSRPASPAAVPATDPHGAGEDLLAAALRRVTVGEYDVLGLLGRGGMAAVYLAHDLGLDRRVAIKVLAPGLGESPRLGERFIREARISASLQHPHIVPIHAVRRHPDLMYFAMAFIDGPALDAVVARHGALPLPVAMLLLHQLGGALAHAHRRSVIHRDVKPANVLIDVDGTSVVTDFGIAKAGDAPGITQTGATVGTPTHMSPEQCRGDEVTAASDQYSFGMVAYELLAGRPAFEGGSALSLFFSHVHEPPPLLLDRRPDCPPAIAAAVHRMLAKSPAERFPDIETALAAMDLRVDAEPARRLLAALARDCGRPSVSLPTTPSSPIPPARPAAFAPRAPSAVPGTSATGASGAWPVASTAERTGERTAEYPAGVTGPLILLPSASVLSVGQTVRFTLARRGASRLRIEGATWHSDAPGVIRCGPDGELHAEASGDATITATLGEESVSARLSVTRVEVARLQVAPGSVTLRVGDEAELRAWATDALGNRLGGRHVVWQSSDPAVASVDARGRLDAHGPGYAEIVASCGRVIASATVRVAPAIIAGVRVEPLTVVLREGETAALTATVVGESGRPLRGIAVVWSSADPQLAQVDAAGTLTALSTGATRITAAAGEFRGVARVMIRPARR